MNEPGRNERAESSADRATGVRPGDTVASVRCFVAVEPGDPIVRAMHEVLPVLRGAVEADDVRVGWTRPEGWHVTLAFLGDVAEEAVAEIGADLERALEGAAPFEIEASGLLLLPSPSRPRVIAVAVAVGEAEASGREAASDTGDALSRLAHRVRRATGTDDGSFLGHLTLARLRRPLAGGDGPGGGRVSKRKPALLALRARVDELQGRSFGRVAVGSVRLMRSELGPGGARYSCIRQIPLEGASVAANRPDAQLGHVPTV